MMTIYKMVISIFPAGTWIDVSAIKRVIAGVSTMANMVDMLVKLMDRATFPLAR